jgi:Tfp pilus assembly protein PilO
MNASRAQTANEVVFSLGYALELEDKLRDAEAQRAELRKVKAELAETKATAARGAGVRRIKSPGRHR